MVNGFFTLGSDDDSIKTVRNTVRFAIDNKIDFNPMLAPAEFLLLWDVIYDGIVFKKVLPIKNVASEINKKISELDFSTIFYKSVQKNLFK